MKFDKHFSISQLARPINADVFHVYMCRADIISHRLYFDLRRGAGLKYKVRSFSADESYLRMICREPVIRQHMIDLYGPQIDLFDYLDESLESRLTVVISHLSNVDNTSFMLLRGSEVSLDQLVQLQNSPLHHQLSKEVQYD